MTCLVQTYKDLPRKKASDKVLCDKVFNIAKNPNYDGYEHVLTSSVYNFRDKKFLMVPLHVQMNQRLKVKLCRTNNQLKNYTNLLLENVKKKKYTHLMKTIFGG